MTFQILISLLYLVKLRVLEVTHVLIFCSFIISFFTFQLFLQNISLLSILWFSMLTLYESSVPYVCSKYQSLMSRFLCVLGVRYLCTTFVQLQSYILSCVLGVCRPYLTFCLLCSVLVIHSPEFAKLHMGLVVLVKKMSVLINFLLQNTNLVSVLSKICPNFAGHV